MMKIRLGLIWLLCGVLAACRPGGREAASPKLYDAGVSLELAQLRKQTIHDLAYELCFTIPEEKAQPVTGDAAIRFRLDRAQEVILDFRAEGEQIAAVTVNGEPAAYTFRNEHILLSDTCFRKGDNVVGIRFTAGDQSLNRNDEYLYTLLVPDRARTVFPCFEQPNLKATFRLQLSVPEGWQAVSNTRVERTEVKEDRLQIAFAPTEPLSTYLFSFVAGRLESRSYTGEGHTVTAYYRETDAAKLAQLDQIFHQVVASLRWLEEYTGIPYPFAKYDFVILPGFQYGGMEHTGATLYNDTQLFLGAHPTPDEELRRAQLIAHETAHMWFGDLVTMDWFDDVWTKEVFANYFAARITEPLFPGINHRLNWMKTYAAAALSEDRTEGTTAIRQPLDNLRNAGLIYGQIIYNKAPVVMQKLVEILGEEAFRKGIGEYLRTYAYGNATWDDLIRILDAGTKEDLAAFSEVWVNQKGMPVIELEKQGGELQIWQLDASWRELLWRQRFNVTFVGADGEQVAEVCLDGPEVTLPIPAGTQYILPNTDGRGYGLFIPEASDFTWMTDNWHKVADDTAREALLMVLHELYQAEALLDKIWIHLLLDGLADERNALIASTVVGYLSEPLLLLDDIERLEAEKRIEQLADGHPLVSCRAQLWRLLIGSATSPVVTEHLYRMWETQDHPLLNERDYMRLAWELAVRFPEREEEILRMQRRRITNPDRRRQFDFVARAVTSDTLRQDSLFNSLLVAENRRIEPWTRSVLGYLNHPLRQERAVKYIRPALEALEDVQRTGDIFFPRNWVGALLAGHRTRAALSEVDAFLEERKQWSPLLLNKVRQAVSPLRRAVNTRPARSMKYKFTRDETEWMR